MRAIRVEQFGEPDVMRVVDVEEPQPREGEVVVHIRAAGVNPVDAYVRSGKYARLPELPYTPGSDGAGIVKHVGAGVTGLSAGDRVYVAALGVRLGTYAEKMAVAARLVHPIPAAVPSKSGVRCGSWANRRASSPQR